jgi:hypothetical protein
VYCFGTSFSFFDHFKYRWSDALENLEIYMHLSNPLLRQFFRPGVLRATLDGMPLRAESMILAIIVIRTNVSLSDLDYSNNNVSPTLSWALIPFRSEQEFGA